MSSRTGGFTLIELMIAMAIFAFLILLAGPMYADFMGNTQIRTAAESALSGVRSAQTTAVHTNQPAKLVVDTTAVGGWSVFAFDETIGDFAAASSDSYRWAEGAARTSVTLLPGGATEITFDGLGRIIPNADATLTIKQIDVTNTFISSPRPLRIAVSTPDTTGTKVGTKLCDPAPDVVASDPRYCP